MRIFWERLRTSSVLGALIALTLLTGALGVHLSPAGSAEVVEASDGTAGVEAGNNYFCDPAVGNDADPAVYCEATVHVGDSVQWDNIEGFHDVTECGSSWNKFDGVATCAGADWASGFMPAGASFTQPFDTAGTYDYLCQIHGLSMKGRIIVLSTTTPTPTSAPTATPTPSVTTTPTATQAPTPTATPTPAATQASPTPSTSTAPTLEPTSTPTQAPSPTPALTSSPSATASPTPTGSPALTASPTPTPQVTAKLTPTATPEPVETPTPSAGPSDVAVLPSSGGIPGIGSGFGVGGFLLIADLGLAMVTAAAFGWFVGRRASG